jgi:two-component system, OmpR family, alkaline phosphatase synthesis response regulator PhoP
LKKARRLELPGRKVLVVDDDVKTVELVKLYLSREGYRVLTAYDGVEALRLAREGHPDLIVLDLMLPDIYGLEVCRVLRRESDVPIIMLTARTTDEDKLTGLDAGADDYVTKPFSPGELVARVRAVFRRLPGERAPAEIKYDELAMDLEKQEVRLADRLLSLTNVEFKLLSVLARNPGRVFSRAELIERALGYDFEGFDRTIDVHVLNLRRKIEPDPSRPRYIKTVYGVGYRFGGGEP